MTRFMERKIQQQTLSIRVPETLRNYLERARVVLSGNANRDVSTSDVAKFLLESARDDRLDDRIQVADLRTHSVEALLAIRQKWEQHNYLSRAECIFLAQYAQVGCEELADNPATPRAESFQCVLEAFLAVRALRVDRGIELDRYYLGNLRIGDTPTLTQRQIDPDAVPKAAANLITELCTRPVLTKPVFVGRNLYVALKDESLDSIISINRALLDRLPVLYRLAARGHWLREGLPVRPSGAISGPCSPAISQTTCEDYCISSVVTSEGELEISILMERKRVTYPLTRFPELREFASMLDHLVPGSRWQGREFIGWTTNPDGPTTLYNFRNQQNAITISFTLNEWQSLKACVDRALAQPELIPVVDELSLAYGEI
jgi:hypothetical protein